MSQFESAEQDSQGYDLGHSDSYSHSEDQDEPSSDNAYPSQGEQSDQSDETDDSDQP